MSVILFQILLSRNLDMCCRRLAWHRTFKSSQLGFKSLILIDLFHQLRIHFYSLVAVSEKVFLSVHSWVSFLKQILGLRCVFIDKRECFFAVKSLLNKLQLTLSLLQIRRYNQWFVISYRDVVMRIRVIQLAIVYEVSTCSYAFYSILILPSLLLFKDTIEWFLQRYRLLRFL